MSLPATSASLANTGLDVLSDSLGPWTGILTARARAADLRAKIDEVLVSELLPPDTGLLVFGSLGRDECTRGSDIDWTLLIDGPADPTHVRVVQRIRRRFLEAGLKAPGPTGLFGGMAFSHQLIHMIGGESDTNTNITQRILLLLESRSVGRPASGGPDDVRDRVVRAILGRYLEDDLSLYTPSGGKHKVPRFLLNDIVRFWRTMAVDYASKRRERDDAGWALRNVKLRFSRKLVFVAGVLTCLSCQLLPTTQQAENLFIAEETVAPIIEHLHAFSQRSPLEILASVAQRFCRDDTTRRLFASYDAFLQLIDDDEKRRHLEELPPQSAEGDAVFAEARHRSYEFQSALIDMFFRSDDDLTRMAHEYCVF